MAPGEFWDSTLHEIGLFLEGAQAARRDEWNGHITTAWHAAAFVWSKKLPRLEKVLLGEVERERPQTAQDIVNRWRVFFGRAPSNVGH